MSREQLIESVSRMMAAAYWRGRHNEWKGASNETAEDTEWINRVAENDRERWVRFAEIACGDALLERQASDE